MASTYRESSNQVAFDLPAFPPKLALDEDLTIHISSQAQKKLQPRFLEYVLLRQFTRH